MSGVDQIVKKFANLGEGDREAAMKAFLAMMPVSNEPVAEPVRKAPTAKKKVNGFMGFRSNYSPLFSYLPQKMRSPFMTILWQYDPYHNEWDFMCSVYSSIRTDLEEQNVTLQLWIHYAIGQMGLIDRDHYMASFGWRLGQTRNGTTDLFRTAIPMVRRNLQPMNGLCLLIKCLESGLSKHLTNPHPIIAKLQDPSFDMIWINKPPHHQQGHTDQADNSELGMPSLFPGNHAVAAEVDGIANLPLSHRTQQGDFGTEPGFSTQFDTMLDSILENGNHPSNSHYNMSLAMDLPMTG
uniref:Mating type protein mtA-1 n=1 Tax=Sordaria equina TaxID=68456 RepID=MTA1_SOREQ|nr:RecName: Full=Mating type protein mtA-1 [Sordaria equina]CAA75439.1 mating type protein [Sordaria equina]